ncbi:hypothetical protein SLOPH_231 [Spraguea lophii 42_110]|uniref:Tc1-like transposase DDE domain-containing protein n=1 Tax=Spraguea lophii (strain 42_110) TaxID=1358809 RepID=S7WBZ4_SPRLO|nr:hypothetical protein SLOPH_231 [Spraguea lophii 42_110]
MSDTHNISVGKSIIDRTLESFCFTLKRVFIIPERRNNETTIIKREEFARNYFNKILEIDDKNFIFIDEVCFSVSMRNKHGRFPEGIPANIATSNIRTKNISVIASVNRYQKIDFHVNHDPVNGINFKEYILRFIRKYCEIKIIIRETKYRNLISSTIFSTIKYY